MIEKKLAVLALGCLLLQGCRASESDAQQVVRDGLKDPGSAKFGAFSQIGDRLGCMTVNSKNSLGGYTGDRQALLRKVDGKWVFYSVVNVSHKACINNWPQIDRELSADDLLKEACAEQKAMGEEYSTPSEGICLYGHAMSNEQKLSFVDSWNNVRESLSNLKAMEAEGRAKGFIR